LCCLKVKHSRLGSVKMFVDHSDWAKTTQTTKARAFKSNLSKKMGEEDEEATTAYRKQHLFKIKLYIVAEGNLILPALATL